MTTEERIYENAAGNLSDLLMACHDVIRDMIAIRQGRPSAFVSSERLEKLAKQCSEAAAGGEIERLERELAAAKQEAAELQRVLDVEYG